MELDPETLEYYEWESNLGGQFWGTKLKNTPFEHGVVREIDKFGQLFETQYKEGKQHGYARMIMKDGTYVVCLKKEDLSHGKSTQYTKDGAKKWEGVFKENEIESEQTF